MNLPQWKRIMLAVQGRSIPTAAMVRQAMPWLDGDVLLLEFPSTHDVGTLVSATPAEQPPSPAPKTGAISNRKPMDDPGARRCVRGMQRLARRAASC